ncbi:hypothetical protein [Variovorax sp. dw_308]|uniref:hypothetical protein n=1 Tax=Variovorax sp. dw_308 TaxID=2721546 RepID=UPI001C471427|nr:hypothetical protein [Variovorax sp. dw_308]
MSSCAFARVKHSALACALFASLSTAAVAQHNPDMRGPSKPSRGVLPGEGKGAKIAKLECCKCVGETASLDLSTGVATWIYKGSAAPTITPYQYWTTEVATNKTIDTGSVASWININNTNSAPQGNYQYTLDFNLPDCVIGSTINIEGVFSADNDASVYLDNVNAASLLGRTSVGQTANYGFMNGHGGVFNKTVVLSPGNHKLIAVVYNDGSFSGFQMKSKMTRKCQENVERSKEQIRSDTKAANVGRG